MIIGTGLRFDADALLKDYLSLQKVYPILPDQISVTLTAGIIVAARQQEKDPPLSYLAGTNWDFAARNSEVEEERFSELSPFFEGTYIEEIWGHLKRMRNIGRVRILTLQPKTCYSWHQDPEESRFHIPFQTDDGAMFIWEQGDKLITERMPEAGRLYEFHTRVKHTAINASFQPRHHLVFNLY